MLIKTVLLLSCAYLGSGCNTSAVNHIIGIIGNTPTTPSSTISTTTTTETSTTSGTTTTGASTTSGTTTTEASTTSGTTTTEASTTSGITTTSTISFTSTASTTGSTTSNGTCQGVTKYDYDKAISLSNLFFQAQRSGNLDAFGDFNHDMIPYRGDSCLQDGSDNGVDLVGGYFDAGDHVKFNFPMAASTTLLAWGAIDFKKGYAKAGQSQETLNTIKWATDYFIKCHISPNELYAQVGDGKADHSQWTRAEDMTIPRPSFKIDENNPGSDLAGETSAALAASSMAFSQVDPEYSAVLLQHSRELFNFAETYRGSYSGSVPGDFYSSGRYQDELFWSAAWLYKATGEQFYLNKANSFFLNIDVGEFSWAQKTVGAMILLAQLTNEDKYVKQAVAFCNTMADTQPKTPKGLVMIRPWGPLRHASNVAFACLQAANIDDPRIDKEKYRQFAVDQIHYALGDTGRSFVVGYGVNPPERPHHRSSSCPVDPNQSCGWDDYKNVGPNPSTLWGALVGGPGADDSYEDDRSDYVKNEVACDYNAGFQSALAGLRTLAAEGTLPGLDGQCK